MKKHLIYIVTALLVVACSGNKQSFTLSGKFKGLDQGEFLCFSESAEWGTLDTVKIMAGQFELKHALTDTTIITLQYPNFMRTQVVAIPGEAPSLRGDANNMGGIEVNGDDENEALTSFRKSIVGLNDRQATSKAEEFIRQNPHLWASTALFKRYFVEVENPDLAKLESLLSLMLKVRPNRTYLHSLKAQLSGCVGARTGKKLPRFKATTLGGQNIDNSTFRGKAVLISFWSTMSSECIYPVVNQRALMRRLANTINQLNICLDVDTVSCQRIIRTDTLGGYHVCDLQTFNSPLVASFGVHQLPSNILVDSTGIVVARNIDPEKLEATLRRYGIK